ncbi:hypothetical protein AQJ91_30160 [Streptomyces dysideae]|uniref:Uncharacterized protein n=1 Tax=Streptomyces dysideae TaxID=909626 RepID=A0A101UV28_9ACTN|nr:hypothetical protein AQJ91_30160 [Streptomyces dysideae]
MTSASHSVRCARASAVVVDLLDRHAAPSLCGDGDGGEGGCVLLGELLRTQGHRPRRRTAAGSVRPLTRLRMLR